jgi:6-phosphogluconate dehydrogenase
MGTSGGVFGLERGYCLMIGGDDTAVARLDRSSARWRPASTPPRARPAATAIRAAEQATCTAAGRRGHFVKMVHNGIEYGMMAAYAEG